ncbi:biopolymer transporter ExbD [Magnetospirillum sp. 15-1]|uniref:ExbD/TolR family protein n=1 Tax=Magnetospirillum sp. 15-1 TaxID=1979370 RepID=UPI000BBCB5D1|nr:biopolymer transporter ExbD [Magnetospirillum sp. 15-1]
MDDKPFESMNVIPFVDIMLVLLTIVLTTSSFIATGRIAVHLPQASQTVPEKKEERRIELRRDGEILFDDKPTTLPALKGELAGLGPETSFIIRADREISFQSFIDVADLLKTLNFSKVAIQTETRR